MQICLKKKLNTVFGKKKIEEPNLRKKDLKL